MMTLRTPHGDVTVRLTAWQVITMVGLALSVLGSVAVVTERLSYRVDSLDTTLLRMVNLVDSADRRSMLNERDIKHYHEGNGVRPSAAR